MSDGKGFYEFAQKRREEQIRQEIEFELQLLELALDKDDFKREQIRDEVTKARSLDKIEKQVNDLHTVVMSSSSKSEKAPKAKKPTKKDRLNEILAKRAFNSVTKNS